VLLTSGDERDAVPVGKKPANDRKANATGTAGNERNRTTIQVKLRS
jgi:hypothetical protein